MGGKIISNDADKNQIDLLIEVVEFKKGQNKTKRYIKKKAKRDTLKSLNALYEGREMVLNVFKSGICPFNLTEGTGRLCMLTSCTSDLVICPKILIPKQILQKLPAQVLAEVKIGNTSENLQYEIRQIIYSLYHAEEVTKEVFKNIMN